MTIYNYNTIIIIKTLILCYKALKRCDDVSTDKIIEQYANRISEDLNLNLIISDRYGILSKENPTKGIGIINGWHNGEYCLNIKSDYKLWKRCVALKTKRDKKLLLNYTPRWHICYCGVAEYVVPVVFNGVLIAEISATGYRAELSEKMQLILSRRINLPRDEFQRLHNNLKNKEDLKTKTLDEYLLPIKEMILKIAAENEDKFFFSSSNIKDASVQYVMKALDYIGENFSHSITAKDVAEYCNVNLSYLQHLFSKFHIRGVFGEILFKRMEKACYMLKNTSCSVKEIALNCGFNNIDYFSVAFKKQCGISPLKYRNL